MLNLIHRTSKQACGGSGIGRGDDGRGAVGVGDDVGGCGIGESVVEDCDEGWVREVSG